MPEVEVRQRPEPAFGEHPAGADGERRQALGERHRDEGLLRRRLLGDPAHLVGVHAHRLLHHERDAEVEQVVRGPGHAAVLAERHDEVGLRLRQHLAVVGEDRRVADRRRPPRGDLRAGVVQADQLDVRACRRGCAGRRRRRASASGSPRWRRRASSPPTRVRPGRCRPRRPRPAPRGPPARRCSGRPAPAPAGRGPPSTGRRRSCCGCGAAPGTAPARAGRAPRPRGRARRAGRAVRPVGPRSKTAMSALMTLPRWIFGTGSPSTRP